MERGTYTREEIHSQPQAWSAALDVLDGCKSDFSRLVKNETGPVVFTGCGSTYYLALAAAALFRGLTGRSATGLPASELWLYPENSYPQGKVTLIAISRSGETSETLRACQDFLEDGRGNLITFSCYPDEPLATLGHLNVLLESGAENSIAQTRAFSTLYLGAVAMSLLAAGRADLYDGLRRLPEAGQRLLDTYGSLAAEIGGDLSLDRFYWLGTGPRYGLASELSLKMKEMTLSHSEPFHFLEFRHGPKSMITPSAQVVGLRSSANSAQEQAVLDDMKSLGGRVLTIAEDHADVELASGLDELIRNVLYLPVGQMIAFERSIAKGFNPDKPNNLDAVVKL
jgi:glucosamine--fructose-6-phosphate aminotransferase (isomerizing)